MQGINTLTGKEFKTDSSLYTSKPITDYQWLKDAKENREYFDSLFAADMKVYSEKKEVKESYLVTSDTGFIVFLIIISVLIGIVVGGFLIDLFRKKIEV